jgi:hypothetical protein
MNIKGFEKELRSLVGDAKGMRPLLCEGNPLTCAVALVGANPRTTTPFWRFWNGERGMDRRSWIDEYLKQHGKFERSRSAIERFIPKVEARVVELNAYADWSNRLADLEHARRTSEVLAFVLRSVRPKVIICAGKHAQRAIDEVGPRRSTVFEEKHFIYWGRTSERDLADRVNLLL